MKKIDDKVAAIFFVVDVVEAVEVTVLVTLVAAAVCAVGVAAAMAAVAAVCAAAAANGSVTTSVAAVCAVAVAIVVGVGEVTITASGAVVLWRIKKIFFGKFIADCFWLEFHKNLQKFLNLRFGILCFYKCIICVWN